MKSYDIVRADIRKKVFQKKYNKVFNEAVNKLKEDAEIIIYNEKINNLLNQ